MEPAKIVKDDWDVEARLADFGATKGELIEVARAAAGAKADAVEDDPITAPGTFSYIFGTRALRQVFRSKGYNLNRSDGIESVYDPERGIKIVFQNADSAADIRRDPRAISDKGDGAVRVVSLGQGSLFWDVEGDEVKEAAAEIWYYFVHINGCDVRAELSRPRSIDDHQFKGFHERIFIIGKVEFDQLKFVPEDNNPPEELTINITRK